MECRESRRFCDFASELGEIVESLDRSFARVSQCEKREVSQNETALDVGHALSYFWSMLISRWQAQVLPTKEQIKMIFLAEGLEPQEEIYPVNSKVTEHRHPFDEVRMVVAGELFINVSGNQMLLRPGDRIEIPSNTRHETHARGNSDCVCVYARRVSI